MNNLNPKLEQHAPFWKSDLPGPNEKPEQTSSLQLFHITPNHLNEIYLEFPTATLKVRGFCIFGLAIIVMLITFGASLVAEIKNADGSIYFESLILGVATIFICCWATTPYMRMDFELPRDQPIRFNRLRQKVYIYRYHHYALNPFNRTKWGVRPAVYNWEDLHAESSGFYIPTIAMVQLITLCALKPGTTEVVDRFPLVTGVFHGEDYWAMIRLYMQQGPEALPPFPYEPRDWDADPVCPWAPKVQWPADMDLESQTAPEKDR